MPNHSGDPYFWGKGCTFDPCINKSCGSLAICTLNSKNETECSCVYDDLLKDPEDEDSCVEDPCINKLQEDNCERDFEFGKCNCQNSGSAINKNGHYSPWSDWSPCPGSCRESKSNSPMIQTRTRICYLPQTEEDEPCQVLGPSVEKRICGEALCPQKPSWTNWGPWESCSSPCKEMGQGTQERRRFCLPSPNTNQSCEIHKPSGPFIQKRNCLTDMSCKDLRFEPWSEWGQCDQTCRPFDGKSHGVQLRKRNCVADEPAAVCESLHESVKTQFRLCKDLSLCQEDDENLCHQDWYRIKPSGPYLYGCNDIFNNGTFACPSPGGVDVDSVLNPNEVYLCKSKKIRKKRSLDPNQANDESKSQCHLVDEVRQCKKNAEAPECEKILEILSEEAKLKSTLEKDLMHAFISTAGWNPLTDDTEHFINPFIKFIFFQDVLENLDKLGKECAKIYRQNYLTKNQQCSDNTDSQSCRKMKTGIIAYEVTTEDTIAELFDLTDTLDEVTKSYAKKNIATSSVAVAAGIASTVIGVMGVACAPFTGGVSLAITAVSAVAATASIATGIASLVLGLEESGITNKKMKYLEKRHNEAGQCTTKMHQLHKSVLDSYGEVEEFMQSNEGSRIGKAMADMPDFEAQLSYKKVSESFIAILKDLEIPEDFVIPTNISKLLAEEAKKDSTAKDISRSSAKIVTSVLSQSDSLVDDIIPELIVLKSKSLDAIIPVLKSESFDAIIPVLKSLDECRRLTGKAKAICFFAAKTLGPLTAYLNVAIGGPATKAIADTLSTYGKTKDIAKSIGKTISELKSNLGKIQWILDIENLFDPFQDALLGQLSKRKQMSFKLVKKIKDSKLLGWVESISDWKLEKKKKLIDLFKLEETRQWVRDIQNLLPEFQGPLLAQLSKTKQTTFKFIKKIKDTKLAISTGLKNTKAFKAFRSIKSSITSVTTSVKTSFKAGITKVTSAIKNSKVGIKVGKLAGSTAGKVAAQVGLGLLDVGLGIWTIYDSVEKLKGNGEAQRIRAETRKINVIHTDVKKIFKDVHQKKSCTIIPEGNSSTTL